VEDVGVDTRVPGRRSLVVGAVGLTVAGQVLLQVVAAVLPQAVRFPGPWVPTPTPDSSVLLSAALRLPELKAEHVTKLVVLVLLRVDAAMGLEGWGLVAVQVIMLGVASVATGLFVAARWGRRAGSLAAAALALNPQITQWAKTIMTDSLFMSMMVLLVLVLARVIEQRDPRALALVLGLAFLAVLLRPNGLGAAVGVLFVLTMLLPRLRLLAATLGLVSIAAVVVLSPVFVTPGGEENTLAARTYEGLVIWVAPDDVSISMPAPADPTDLSNTALVRYAAAHPAAVLNLGLQRVAWELIQVRAHYPRLVNLITGMLMVAVAGLTAVGAYAARGSSLNRAVVPVCVGLALVIAATWAIAEGRFGWAMMATWAPWIGIGLDRLLGRVPGARRRVVAP